MADTKISALTAVATPAGTDEYATNQGAVSKRTTLAQVKTFVNTAPVFAAGTASAATWPVLTAGTLLTTAEVGALELDANALYGTTDAGNRGVIPIEYIIRADADRTFTSNTTAQAIFNSPANGRITLETGCYLVEALIHMNTMSATSGNATFNMLGAGSATLAAQLIHLVGVDGASGTAATQTGSTILAGNGSPASAVTAGTGTAMTLNIRGTFEVSGAGTVQPTLALVTANAAVVKLGSYMRIRRIGSTGLVSVGQWD